MNTEEDMKRLCQNFLQSYEQGNYAYDSELSNKPTNIITK